MLYVRENPAGNPAGVAACLQRQRPANSRVATTGSARTTRFRWGRTALAQYASHEFQRKLADSFFNGLKNKRVRAACQRRCKADPPGSGWRLFAADAGSGASSGNQGIGKKGNGGTGDSAANGFIAQHGAPLSAQERSPSPGTDAPRAGESSLWVVFPDTTEPLREYPTGRRYRGGGVANGCCVSTKGWHLSALTASGDAVSPSRTVCGPRGHQVYSFIFA